MRKGAIPFANIFEEDALTDARQDYNWGAGQVKQIKRAYNKRVRREWKRSLWQER